MADVRVVNRSPLRRVLQLARTAPVSAVVLASTVILVACLPASIASAAQNWSVVSIFSDAGNGAIAAIDKSVADRTANAVWGGPAGSAVDVAADDAAVAAALAKLGDGDVLVINAVFNARGVAVGNGAAMRTVAWREFMTRWGNGKRPRLSLVILRDGHHKAPETEGMAPEDAKAARDSYRDWTSPVDNRELLQIGEALNALTIMTLKAFDDSSEAPALPGLFDGVFSGDAIAGLADRFAVRFLTPAGIDRKTATLGDLGDYVAREEILACLCKCRQPADSNFQCVYDVNTRKFSKSCRKLDNGACLCRANGCFRRAVPETGACAAACKAGLSPSRGRTGETDKDRADGGSSVLKPSLDPDG